MTDREAMKLAFEKCEWGFMEDAANILRQALAQPDVTFTDEGKTEQEPVAQIRVKNGYWIDTPRSAKVKSLPDGLHDLYTAPRSKPWVGLTEDERNRYISYTAENFAAGVLWAEIKLRERNT